MTAIKVKTVALFGTASLFVIAGRVVATTSDSNEVKGPDGRKAKLEECLFQAAPVHYKYPPIIPPSSEPVIEEVVSPDFPGEPMLSAEFSWQIGPDYPPVNGLRISSADDQGDEFDPGITDLAGTTKTKNKQYWADNVPVFPRRGTNVRLRLLTGEKLIAEFNIPNPSPGPHPVWTPQPLPVHQTNGDLEVTLIGFRALQPGQKYKLGARTECDFNFREQNRGNVDWRPIALEVTDATGNHWRTRSPASTVENSCVRFGFAGALWPGESAWKLRGEFARISRFSEMERLKIAKIRIPDVTEGAYEPHTHYAINGADVELAGVIGTVADSNALFNEHKQLANAERKQGCVTVAFTGQILSRHRRLAFVSADDDKGRSLDLVGFAEPLTLADVNAPVPYSLLISPLVGTREINVIVAITETKFVEFIAQPEQVFPDLSPLR